MATRRERQARKTKKHVEKETPVIEKKAAHNGALFHRIFHDNYKKLLIIPFVLLILALAQIGVQTATTGSFLHKGVSLSGGITLTIPVEETSVTTSQLEEHLKGTFGNEIIVRGLSEFGILKGFTVEIATETGDEESLKQLEASVIGQVEQLLPGATERYSVEVIGPSLGETFFRQTMAAVFIAFMLMGLVVFFYFGENLKAKIVATILSFGTYLFFKGTVSSLQIVFLIFLGVVLIGIYVHFSPPSAAVILAAFSDIVITLAIINLFGIKVSTAGIAAFLMLIGYSVDTDILLSSRVLRYRKGSIYESIVSSMKTGVLMTGTSIAAALVGFLVSQSATIKQIMLIILIGLCVDLVTTWFQNAGIIRLYAERKEGNA